MDLNSLYHELGLCEQYLSSINELKSILSAAPIAIEQACKINEAFSVDGSSADGENIRLIKQDIENILNDTNAAISNTNAKIAQTNSAIQAEEERIRREAEEAAAKAAEDAKNRNK